MFQNAQILFVNLTTNWLRIDARFMGLCLVYIMYEWRVQSLVLCLVPVCPFLIHFLYLCFECGRWTPAWKLLRDHANIIIFLLFFIHFERYTFFWYDKFRFQLEWSVFFSRSSEIWTCKSHSRFLFICSSFFLFVSIAKSFGKTK